MGKFVSQDLLAPVALDASQFVPEAIDAFTYEGTLYGMPYAMENVGLFRNTDLVPEAPTTWEELSQVSSNLVASGTISYGLSLPIPDPYHTHPLQTAYGGYIFGWDADGDYDPSDLGLDNSGSIAAYTWLDQEVEAGRIPHTISWDDSHLLFEEGHAAFLITGPWSLARIRNSGVNYAISPFPAGDAGVGAPFTGVQGIMLNAHAEDLATARAFLLYYLGTTETMTDFYEVSNRPPTYRPVLEQIDDPDLAALAQAAEGAQPMPAIPEMDYVWEAWSDAIEAITTQVKAPATALADAADEIRAAIDGGR